MAQDFGERLRLERERRQVSLESVAAISKVSVLHFQALERGDVSKWPTGIFRRSFIKAYASAVGLDPEATLREFLDLYPDPVQPSVELSAVPEPPAPPARLVAVPPKPSARSTPRAMPAWLLSVVSLLSLPPGLRLRVEDTARMFARRHLISAVRSRWAAVSVDAAVILGTGVALFLFVGMFWMPLAIFMFCYYFGSILVVGNTPGVCLAASAADPPC